MTRDTTALGRAWGAEIRARRRDLGLSRTELAGKLEVTRQMVGYWERGEYVPSPRIQAELIGILGIDPVRLRQIMTAAEGAA